MADWKWTETDWRLIALTLEVAPNVLLYGPPGTGKTYCATHGREDFYSLTMTEETPAAELRGHFIPKGDEGFVWHDGPAIRAWREGCRLIINEVDRASGDILSLLYALADDPDVARLTLPTGETVKPAEGFQVICTTNATPDVLPEALQDRFPVSFHVKDLAPPALESLSEDLRDACKNNVDAPHERRASIRRWRAFDRLREHPRFAELSKEREANGLSAENLAAVAVFGRRAEDICDALKLRRAGETVREVRRDHEDCWDEPDSDNEIVCFSCGSYFGVEDGNNACTHCGACNCSFCHRQYEEDNG